MLYYFAYGSNMDKNELKEWCKNNNKPFPKWEFIGMASLENYEITFNYYSYSRGAGAANIIEKKGSVVYGLLFKVSDEELEFLRIKEGYPDSYEDIKVNVKSEKITYSSVMAYKVTKNKERDHHEQPLKTYLQLIIQNGKTYGFPEDYLNFLEGFVTL